MALIEKLTAIADAVREKTGGDQLLTLDEIRDEITELSTVPGKPYIDSSLIEYSHFCREGKNLHLLTDPNLDTSQAENLENFLYGAHMSDIPAVQLSFPKAKYALRGFSSLGGSVSAENGMDISRLVLFLPSLEEAVRLFESGRFGVMPTVHLSTACRNASRMFYGCSYLREVDLREADGVESFDVAFYNCSQLQTAKLNMQKVTNYINTFYGCGNLTDLSIGSLKIRSNDFRLDSCPLLTVESLVGILNALESNAGEATTYTVVLGSENLAKLTDAQKQIAIDKNLTLA